MGCLNIYDLIVIIRELQDRQTEIMPSCQTQVQFNGFNCLGCCRVQFCDAQIPVNLQDLHNPSDLISYVLNSYMQLKMKVGAKS